MAWNMDVNILIKYAKLLVLALGALMLVAGFIGIMYDYAGDLVIEAGNSGWLLMTGGIALMAVAVAGYVLIPMIREHDKLKQLNEYYQMKNAETAEMNSLAHDISEQLQIIQGRFELAKELSDAMGGEHADPKAIDIIVEELHKQKENTQKLDALFIKLSEYMEMQSKKKKRREVNG
jgi:hypothetical protein